MLQRLRDVFKSFQEHEVRYVVIGGIAAIVHGVPRQTFDLDIGLAFQDAWARRLMIDYHGMTFPVVSREDLIASKRADGRPIDLEDVRLLEIADEPS